MKLIHLCSDADGRGGIKLGCSSVWTDAKWGKEEDTIVVKDTGKGGVYLTETDELYTFSSHRVTCPKCIKLTLHDS